MQATVIGEDIQSCIKPAINPLMHKLLKRIDTKDHFKWNEVDENSVQLVHTPTDQLAGDLLTKLLPQLKVEQHREKLLGKLQVAPPTNGKIWVGVLKKRS